MFRTIVILGVLALCAFMAGWFTIDRNENETTIRFDRDQIRADTSKAIAKGREILNKNRDGQETEQGTEGGFEQPELFGQPQYPAQGDPYNADSFGTQPYNPQPYNNEPYNNEPYNNGYTLPPQQATRTVPPWERPAAGTNNGSQF